MTAGWCGCWSACQASPRLAPCWDIPPLGWHCSRAAGGAPSWGRCVLTSPLEAGLSAMLCTRALSFSLEQPQEVGMSPAGGAPAGIPRPFVSLAPCAGARLGAEQQRAASTCLLPRSPQSPTFSLSPGLKPHKMPVCSVRMELSQHRRSGHYPEASVGLRPLAGLPSTGPLDVTACWASPSLPQLSRRAPRLLAVSEELGGR